MGRLEETASKRLKKDTLKRIILGSVAAAGVLSVALIAPNALQMLKHFGIKPKGRQQEIIKRAYKRLVDQGYLESRNGNFELTARGKLFLQYVEITDFSERRKPKWDKKWRVLIFDIPEYRRSLRDKIRRTLFSIGFMRLQDSVWVYPYNCEDLIALLKADFKVGKNMLYLIVEEMEGDGFWRSRFGLS
ncbi:MAG: hypothetical protein HYV68_02235 [Candidatus Taylorbacteria bacterium]|nr:hypothetical protein [Candidatus Taylorbacteria bacterium]